MRLIAFSLSFLAAATFSQATNADDDSERSPELQVLDRFVGTWDLHMTIKPAEGEETTLKVIERRSWSLGGRFMHFEKDDKDNLAFPEYHLLLTYDPDAKTYPGMLVIGTERSLIDATWDEATNTMTMNGKTPANGSTFVFKTRFIEKDRAEATTSARNADGEVVLEVDYKLTRRKQ